MAAEVPPSNVNKHTIIYTVGRMNPPTIGHMHLIKDMIINSLKLTEDTDAGFGKSYILLSHSYGTIKDKKAVNPLKCNRKIFYLKNGMLGKTIADAISMLTLTESQIKKISVTPICADAPLDPDDTLYKAPAWPFGVIDKLFDIAKIKEQNIDIQVTIGDEYKNKPSHFTIEALKKKLRINRDPIITENTQFIKREHGRDDINPDDPIKSMSGTKMRQLAKTNEKEFLRFAEASGLSEDIAKEFLEEINKNIIKQEAKAAETAKATKSATKSEKTKKRKKEEGQGEGHRTRKPKRPKRQTHRQRPKRQTQRQKLRQPKFSQKKRDRRRK